MRILIIEDEVLSASKLSRMIERLTPRHKIVGSCNSIKSSVKWLSENRCDLIFLDVQLCDGLSFEIFRQVKTAAKIVITSAYDQYAIAAFKIGSVDYLLKPIEEREFIETMARIESQTTQSEPHTLQYNKASEQPTAITIAATAAVKTSYKSRFTIKIGDRILVVDTASISCFASEDKLTVIVTNTGKRYLSEMTLSAIEQVTDPALFFRITRSSIINIRAIKSVSKALGGKLKVTVDPEIAAAVDDSTLIVSRNRVADFIVWLDGN